MAASSSRSPRTSTRFVSKSTETDSTPATAETSFDTAASQLAQCIAGTVYVIVSLISRPPHTGSSQIIPHKGIQGRKKFVTRRPRACPRLFGVDLRGVGGTAAAVLEIPHGCDLRRPKATPRQQILRLPLERAPAPAVATARPVLMGELHRLAVFGLLARRESDCPVVRQQLLCLADWDVVRIAWDLRDATERGKAAHLLHIVLELHRRTARSLQPAVESDRVDRLRAQSALVAVATAQDGKACSEDGQA